MKGNGDKELVGAPPASQDRSGGLRPEPQDASQPSGRLPHGARFTPWKFERMESAVEFAALKGETLADHEGYFRDNNGDWIVTLEDPDGEMGGRVAAVTFKGKAKRGEAWRAPDPIGMARARLIASAPDLYEALVVALPRLAHPHRCWRVRPTTEWAEHGSASFDNCDCEISVVRAALNRALGEG